MGKILIIYHSISGNTKKAAEYLARGTEEVPNTDTTIKPALEAGIDDLLECDGIAIGTPDYFSYMAGGVKDFFDRTFYPTQGKVEDKPCVIFITHGGGGRAKGTVKKICNSFKFDLITPQIMVENSPDEKEKKALEKAGQMLAKKI